jgi:tetratricopeptide (TPR) repeat protein
MFFPRLRRQVKWMFVFLALAFGVGFVVFNVGGAGPSGGIGDLLRDAGGSSGPSVGDAEGKIEANPNDPEGYRELATALQQRGDVDEAIAPLVRYVKLRPRDVDAQQELAALYLRKADRYRDQAQAVQAEANESFGGQIFNPPQTTTIGRALGSDPVTDAISLELQQRLTAASTEMQKNYQLAVAVYLRIARASPNDPSVQLQLAQTAEAAGDSKAAVKAYESFLKLAPEDPSAAAIKDRIKQLKASATVPTAG